MESAKINELYCIWIAYRRTSHKNWKISDQIDFIHSYITTRVHTTNEHKDVGRCSLNEHKDVSRCSLHLSIFVFVEVPYINFMEIVTT